MQGKSTSSTIALVILGWRGVIKGAEGLQVSCLPMWDFGLGAVWCQTSNVVWPSWWSLGPSAAGAMGCCTYSVLYFYRAWSSPVYLEVHVWHHVRQQGLVFLGRRGLLLRSSGFGRGPAGHILAAITSWRRRRKPHCSLPWWKSPRKHITGPTRMTGPSAAQITDCVSHV